jgi:hypothetical protein
MKPDRVITALETTIVRVTRDIKKKQGSVGSDKLNSLSKLLNSYNRLLEQMKRPPESDLSDNNYYAKMEKEYFDSRQI